MPCISTVSECFFPAADSRISSTVDALRNGKVISGGTPLFKRKRTPEPADVFRNARANQPTTSLQNKRPKLYVSDKDILPSNATESDGKVSDELQLGCVKSPS
eukprot:3691767-Pyramimonas_sp.AAC.1